ncbi:MAG: hypothetical protein JSU96_01125, partial [Acidobacteriota bacterium]
GMWEVTRAIQSSRTAFMRWRVGALMSSRKACANQYQVGRREPLGVLQSAKRATRNAERI